MLTPCLYISVEAQVTHQQKLPKHQQKLSQTSNGHSHSHHIPGTIKHSKVHIKTFAFLILLLSGCSVCIIKCRDQIDVVFERLRTELGPGCFVSDCPKAYIWDQAKMHDSM